MGHDGGPGHCEIRYEDCRVPGRTCSARARPGFVIAQDRLGPGRIHHCMRAIGTAERAIEMMCRRANEREAFGGKLAEKQFVQDFIAKSRMETEQARLLTLKAAWKMDTEGKRAARQRDLDDQGRRRQRGHGRARPRDPGPRLARHVRRHAARGRCGASAACCKVADGPDEVHKMVIARRELNRCSETSRGGARAPPAQPRASKPRRRRLRGRTRRSRTKRWQRQPARASS